MIANSRIVILISIDFFIFCSQIGYSQPVSDSIITNDSVFIFENVNVITMQNNEVLKGQTVIIKGDFIE